MSREEKKKTKKKSQNPNKTRHAETQTNSKSRCQKTTAKQEYLLCADFVLFVKLVSQCKQT